MKLHDNLRCNCKSKGSGMSQDEYLSKTNQAFVFEDLQQKLNITFRSHKMCRTKNSPVRMCGCCLGCHDRRHKEDRQLITNSAHLFFEIHCESKANCTAEYNVAMLSGAVPGDVLWQVLSLCGDVSMSADSGATAIWRHFGFKECLISSKGSSIQDAQVKLFHY